VQYGTVAITHLRRIHIDNRVVHFQRFDLLHQLTEDVFLGVEGCFEFRVTRLLLQFFHHFGLEF
jgi:hypothetical protein